MITKILTWKGVSLQEVGVLLRMMIDNKKYNLPTAIVVFGGTGDLAQTKLFPALLDLYVTGALPDKFVIIGLSRKILSDQEYRDFVKESINKKGHQHDSEAVSEFCSHLRYLDGSFDDDEAYTKIKTALLNYDTEIKQCTNKLFYLAVPPQYYNIIFEQLNDSQAMALCDNHDSWSRLLVEKPFGRDLETAQVLEDKLCNLFTDEQVYRIDHYLEKDAIENIISLRFANSILTDSWNKDNIESIDIRLLEEKDVSNRGSFYDNIGTLRDVGQNHLLQMLALLTMSKVDVHDAASVRKARAEALSSLLSQGPDRVVRGQYEGFTETLGVEEDSETETYFKISFVAKDSEWSGVHFSLEAGKALDKTINEAVITFRSADNCNCAYTEEVHQHKNVLKIQFALEQHICLSMWMKEPGFEFSLKEQKLVLLHEKTTDSYSPEAYERVLYDCISGNQTRFVSSDEVEAAWRFVTPIIESFKNLPLLKYPKGSSGPTDAK